MLNASVGVQRVLGRVRRTSIDSITEMTILSRPRVSTRASRSRYGYMATSAHVFPAPRRRRRAFVMPSLSFHRPSIRSVRSMTRAFPRLARHAFVGLGHERVVAIAAAGILLSASFLSVAPGGPSGDTGGPSGDGKAPRLAIAGSGDGDDVGTVEEDYVTQSEGQGEGGPTGPSRTRISSPRRSAAPRPTTSTRSIEPVSRSRCQARKRLSPARSSTTARCSSRSRSTRRCRTAAPS